MSIKHVYFYIVELFTKSYPLINLLYKSIQYKNVFKMFIKMLKKKTWGILDQHRVYSWVYSRVYSQ